MIEEQILEFLDGNLSATEEEELLHRLAVSPERRQLLRQHLQVREMVGTLARKQFSHVPGALTASVFSSVAALGYSGPQPPVNPSVTEHGASLKPPVPNASATTGIRKRTVGLLLLASLLLGGSASYFLGLSNNSSAGSSKSHEIVTRNTTSANNQATLPATTELSAQSASQLNTVQPTAFSAVTPSIHKNHTGAAHSSSTTRLQSDAMTATEAPVAVNTTTEQKAVAENGVNNAAIIPTKNEATPENQPIISTTNTTDIHGSNNATERPANPFDAPDQSKQHTITSPMSFSVRYGGGKIPGSTQAYTGSLAEIRASYHLLSWLSISGSIGQFMPYESAVIAAGLSNNDGIQLLKLNPALQYKQVAGAELTGHLGIEGLPLDLSIGTMNDFAGTWIPRASLFTSLEWESNLVLRLGVEGMFYRHDVNAAIMQAQSSQFSGQRTMMLGAYNRQEITGFLGPALELSWKF